MRLALARHRAQLSQPTAGAGQKQDLSNLDRLIRDTSFATFRQELLSRDRPFADPSADFFDLVGHQQRVANAKNRMADLNIFKAFLQKRIEPANSGLTQLEVDLVAAAHWVARKGFDAELLAYRDRLDEVKLTLRLAPEAPVIPDSMALASLPRSFREERRVVAQSPARLRACLRALLSRCRFLETSELKAVPSSPRSTGTRPGSNRARGHCKSGAANRRQTPR